MIIPYIHTADFTSAVRYLALVDFFVSGMTTIRHFFD